ncbi:MAG: hypothetical protein WC712_01130 [Candidatus Brocadiia bacterium]
MFRRTLAIALLTAVFCCTLSIPKADEPAADSLAKYLPAETFLYIEAADLAGTMARGDELAFSRLMSEGNLWKVINDQLDAAFIAEDNPPIDFEKISKMFSEMKPRIASAFTGSSALAIPAVAGDMPIIVAGFRIAEGKNAEAAAIVEEIVSKLVNEILPSGLLAVKTTEYKGSSLYGILDNMDPKENEVPWFCVSGGFAFISFGMHSMTWMLDALAAPPAASLLNLPAFRNSYATVSAKDIRGYFSFGSLLRNYQDFRSDMDRELGARNVLSFENATLTYGMTFNKLAVEDELYVSLGGKQWPFPVDFFPANSPCTAVSAALFPADTAGYLCANLAPARILELISQLGASRELEALKAKGVDVENGIIPLLGPEFSLGVIARGSIPTGMIAVQLKDAAAALDWFRNLAMVENEVLGDPMEFGGATVFPYRPRKRDFLDLPREIGTMAFAVKEGWLLYGPVLTLKNQLTSKAAALPTNEDFAATVPPMLTRQPQVLTFINLRSIARQYYPLLAEGITHMGRGGADIAALMPASDLVEQYAIPMVMCGSITPEGGRLFSTGPEGFTAVAPIMAAIAIPNMIGARRSSSQVAALVTCKTFGSCAVAYSQTRPTQDYWGSGTKDFSPYFKQISPKGGYKYRYFSNSSAPDKDDAVKFVYMAVPVSTSTGRRAYYIDESQTIYVATDPARGNQEDLTSAQIAALNAFIDGADSVPNWEIDDQTRLGITEVEFVRK